MKAVVFAYHDMGCLGVQAVLDAGYDIAAILRMRIIREKTRFWIVSRGG